MTQSSAPPKLYVKDVVNLNSIQYSTLNLLVSPVGTGKTTFALESLCQLATHKHFMIYLIDTVAGRDKIVYHPNAMSYNDSWRWELERNFGFFDNDLIVAMTYAKFGSLVLHCPWFLDNVQLVVCDELDNVFWSIGADRGKLKKQYPCYSAERIEREMKKTSNVYAALNTLQSLWRGGKCRVVAMTATPKKIYSHYGEEVHVVPLTQELEGYKTPPPIYYNNLAYEFSHLEKGKHAIVYLSSISRTKQQMELLIQRGLRVGAIWSLGNKDHPMSDEQKQLRDYIIKERAIPDNIDVLFINKSLERCVDIFGDVAAIYIHSREEDTIIQARGRYRGDLERLYVLGCNEEEIEVPAEFLDRPLFTEDKQALAAVLNLRGAGGRLEMWTTIKKRLEDENNFTVEELPRKNNKRSCIIRGR